MTTFYPFGQFIEVDETADTAISPFGGFFDGDAEEDEDRWNLWKDLKYDTDGIPDEDLDGFPKLFTITADADIAAECASGGGIKVTSPDGLTRLPFGLYPSTNLATGDIIMRVKLDLETAASVGDVLGRIYFSERGTTREDKPGTVSNGYAIFTPLSEDPSGTAPQVLDWVTGNKIGTSSGSMTSGDLVAGQVDLALDMDGNDYISVPNNANFTPVNMTVTCWVRRASTGRMIFAGVGAGGGPGDTSWWLEFYDATTLRFLVSGSGGQNLATKAIASDTTNWHKYSAVFDGSNQYVNEDNGTPGSASNSGDINNFSQNLGIGVMLPYGGIPLVGAISEFTLATVTRSDNWLAYGYADDFSNATTFTLSEKKGWILWKDLKYDTDGIPAEDLDGFPKLFDISGDTDIATECASGGGIRLTSADGLNGLPFGLYPSTDLTAGDILMRVRSDLSAAASVGDVIARLYYSKDGVTVEDKSGTVPDEEIRASLDEDPSGSSPQMFDWVSESNLGTSYGTMTSGDSVTGLIGKAVDFDGNDDYLDFGLVASPVHITAEIWVKETIGWLGFLTGNFGLLGRNSPASTLQGYELGVDGGNLKAAVGNNSNYAEVSVSAGHSTNVWELYALTYDGMTLRAYKNGVELGNSTAISGNIAYSSSSLLVGKNPYNIGGLIDEIRISSAVRSANWLAYSYTDDSDNATTFTLSAEQGGDSSSITPTVVSSAEAFADPSLHQTILAGIVPDTASPVRASPAEDIALGDWADDASGTTDIFESVDETTSDDNDYIRSGPLPSNDVVELKFETIVSGGEHWVKYRFKKAIAPHQMDLTVSLVEGTTVKQTWAHADISNDWLTVRQLVTASISDWSDVRLRFTANQIS